MYRYPLSMHNILAVLTPKQIRTYKFIKEYPDSTQAEIIRFIGGGNHTQVVLYTLLSYRLIKVREEKDHMRVSKKRYSIDERRKL